jgi:hypothetical protein
MPAHRDQRDRHAGVRRVADDNLFQPLPQSDRDNRQDNA